MKLPTLTAPAFFPRGLLFATAPAAASSQASLAVTLGRAGAVLRHARKSFTAASGMGASAAGATC